MAAPGFHKRTLSFVGLLSRLGWLLWHFVSLVRVNASRRDPRPELRAAVWLAVTEVNGCRYCAYIHEGMAATEGLSPGDIALLLASNDPADLQGLTQDEAAVVAWAKVWAESAGAPPAARPESAPRDLQTLLRLIDFANRSGNTLDSLLDRFRHPGRWLQVWGALNDLVVGLLVALFGWPALVAGAWHRFRARRRARASAP